MRAKRLPKPSCLYSVPCCAAQQPCMEGSPRTLLPIHLWYSFTFIPGEEGPFSGCLLMIGWRSGMQGLCCFLSLGAAVLLFQSLGPNKLLHPLLQISSVAQSCPTLWDPVNCSMPGLPVCHQLPEFTQTHVHQVGDAIQPSHPLLSPSPPAPSPSQRQGLFQWINSSHEVAKVLEFQLQHQSFQWTPRTGLL